MSYQKLKIVQPVEEDFEPIQPFDYSQCCIDVTKWVLVVIGIIYTLGVDPIIFCGYDLATKGDFFTYQFMPYFANALVKIGTFGLWVSIIGSMPEAKYFNFVWICVALVVILVQLIGQVISNPILGKGIIFHPTTATFGISLGICVGVAVVITLIVLLVWFCIFYGKKHWVKEISSSTCSETDCPI